MLHQRLSPRNVIEGGIRRNQSIPNSVSGSRRLIRRSRADLAIAGATPAFAFRSARSAAQTAA